MKTTAIVDYGLCNLDSIARAVQECGGNPVVTDRPADLATAASIILPGVGAFPDAMANLHERGLVEALLAQVERQRIPFLGVCLGMQLLASWGFEVRQTHGLGLVRGEVRRLRETHRGERIPHVGWDEVHYRSDCPLFRGIPSGSDFYFVHSYHLACVEESDVAATTPYCGGFTSAVARGGCLFGVQFHPEKSQRAGFRLLQNFLSL